jgi:hypothetical protein
VIAVATAPTEHRPDVAVDGLDLPERDLDIRVLDSEAIGDHVRWHRARGDAVQGWWACSGGIVSRPVAS